MSSLKKRLMGAQGRTLVIVEGVYSMEGDTAPLADVAELCQQYHARLMVDEAHSAFVFGEHGRGLAEHCGVEQAIDIHVGTLSKSLGGIGGYVVGSRTMVDYLRAYARAQVFSCAIAPVIVGGLAEALRIAIAEPQLRTRLWKNVAIMRAALLQHGVDIGQSTSQVIPIMVRNDTAIPLQRPTVPAVRPPRRPLGAAAARRAARWGAPGRVCGGDARDAAGGGAKGRLIFLYVHATCGVQTLPEHRRGLTYDSTWMNRLSARYSLPQLCSYSTLPWRLKLSVPPGSPFSYFAERAHLLAIGHCPMVAVRWW